MRAALDQIESWRASNIFRDHVGKIRDLSEGLEPRTMDPLVTVG